MNSPLDSDDDLVLRISDTAGQEEYEHVRALAYSQTDVVFIAFSIMDRDSYANVRTVWNKEKEKFMTAARVGISIS